MNVKVCILRTFLTVVSLKMRCKGTTFQRIMQIFREFFVILHPNSKVFKVKRNARH